MNSLDTHIQDQVASQAYFLNMISNLRLLLFTERILTCASIPTRLFLLFYDGAMQRGATRCDLSHTFCGNALEVHFDSALEVHFFKSALQVDFQSALLNAFRKCTSKVNFIVQLKVNFY